MMPVSGTRIDSITALSLPIVNTDRMIVARSNVGYRNDKNFNRGGLIRRTNILFTKPAASDFSTWLNQGSATLTDVGDALALEHDNSNTSTDDINAVLRAIPSGSWDVELGVLRLYRYNKFITGGLILRESATGKLQTLAHSHGDSNSGLIQYQLNSATSFSSNRRSVKEQPDIAFFRARKVSTNIEFLVSFDGAYWSRWDTIRAANDWFTTAPDQWGFYINTYNNDNSPAIPIRIDVFHWKESP
jgi:hypothetical protein